jgi:hypothetical protein
MNVEQSVEWELAGETEVLGENLPQSTLSTTNPTWPDLGSNPGRRGGKPATNRLSYGTAIVCLIWQRVQNLYETIRRKGYNYPCTSCERLRLPHFLENRLTYGDKVVSPTRQPLLPPGNFLLLISVRGWVDPKAIVQLEGLVQLKKPTSSGTRTGDLQTCSIVPQPTTLPRASLYCTNSQHWMRCKIEVLLISW